MTKIYNMTNKEYETHVKELHELDNKICHKSLLIGIIDENTTVCPYCDNEFSGMSEIREKLLQLMRDYNKFAGKKKYYIAHIEGNEKWEIINND